MIILGSLSLELRAEEVSDCLQPSAKFIQVKAESFEDEIRQAAKRYDVNPKLIQSIIAAESCFDPALVSDEGAIGLMQLMPDTAKRFGALDVFDPASNIDAGTRYLSYLQKRYQGSIAEVVTAYRANEGWEWQQETISTPFKAVRKPVTRILSAWLSLENDKQANRQALLLLEKWRKSDKAYRSALAALPEIKAQQTAAKWLKSRLTQVHYPRSPELRSCAGLSGKAMEVKAAPYQDIIKKAAKRHGVNAALVKSVIAAESCYREMVVSPKGASGLMQLMPETAAELGVMDIFDPEENINAGTRYLSYLLRMYKGSITHAVAAYNAGAGRIEQGVPVTISFAETRGYIQNVLTNLTKLETGKKAIQSAQLLLADWGQAEMEYQAALRGETLVVADVPAEEVLVVDASLPPQPVAPVASGLDSAMAPVQGQQPKLELAYLRSGKAEEAPLQQESPSSVQLISAIDQGIVRVKRISATAVMPVTTAVSASVAAEAVVVEPVPVALVSSGEAGLPDCENLPQSLFAQAEQQGNGRYGAFFYRVQAGESLDMIAARLGVTVQDIGRLGSMPVDVFPKEGSRLKVAECVRSL